MHCNYVLRLHAHAKHLPPTHVPLFGLACGHNMMAALRVIIAILRCKTDCVAACRVSAVLPYVVATAVLSASRHPPHIRKFAGLAKAQRLKRGKGASLRRPTGVGTDLGGSLLTRLVLDPVGRGPARHKAKMYTALACVCDAFLSPCPGKSGFALPTRAAVSCRATPPVRSALS